MDFIDFGFVDLAHLGLGYFDQGQLLVIFQSEMFFILVVVLLTNTKIFLKHQKPTIFHADALLMFKWSSKIF